MKMRMDMEKARKILLDAADYIDAHGWCQKRTEDPYGRVCAVGGLQRTVQAVPGSGAQRRRLFNAACRALSRSLGDNGGAPFDDNIMHYNDDPRRKAHHVTLALRTAALNLGR